MRPPIVVATDFSDFAAQALAYALDLARRLDHPLHLVHVIPDPLAEAPGADADSPEAAQARSAEQAADAHLRAALAEQYTDDLTVEAVVRRSNLPGPALVAYAEQVQACLVVVGTHGRRGLRRMLLGSVAGEVLHHAPCDVLTVPAAATPGGWLRRLFVPVDLSNQTPHQVQTALDLATHYRAELTVAHVLAPVFYPAPVSELALTYLPMPKLEEHLRDELERAAAPYQAQAEAQGVHLQIEILQGDPSYTITTHAEDTSADLIVVATRGLTGLKHLLLGSVAERVARAAPCPVWTVRPVETA